MQNIDVFIVATENLTKAYHRLLLLVGPKPAEISSCIAAIAIRLGRPIINLNFELSTALLDVPRRQRPLKAYKLLGDIIDGGPNDILLFDHTDILFSPSLRLDAMALLKGLARNKSIVATWPGIARGGRLQHADKWHPAYQEYPIEDIKVMMIDHENH